MATGAAPALDPKQENKPEAQADTHAKPVGVIERIFNKLNKIFEHNERLGTTRP
jgi:hypothetical protein